MKRCAWPLKAGAPSRLSAPETIVVDGMVSRSAPVTGRFGNPIRGSLKLSFRKVRCPWLCRRHMPIAVAGPGDQGKARELQASLAFAQLHSFAKPRPHWVGRHPVGSDARPQAGLSRGHTLRPRDSPHGRAVDSGSGRIEGLLRRPERVAQVLTQLSRLLAVIHAVNRRIELHRLALTDEHGQVVAEC